MSAWASANQVVLAQVAGPAGSNELGAVPMYEVLAERFSAYWAGLTDLDSALSAAADGMRQVQKRQ